MKNLNSIKLRIAKQEKLVIKLKKDFNKAYKNSDDNMLSLQANYFIAKEVLNALENVLPLIVREQETLDYYNN